MIYAQRTRDRMGPSSAEAQPLGSSGQRTGSSGRRPLCLAAGQRATPARHQRFGPVGHQGPSPVERLLLGSARRKRADAAGQQGTGSVRRHPSLVATLQPSGPVGHQRTYPAEHQRSGTARRQHAGPIGCGPAEAARPRGMEPVDRHPSVMAGAQPSRPAGHQRPGRADARPDRTPGPFGRQRSSQAKPAGKARGGSNRHWFDTPVLNAAQRPAPRRCCLPAYRQTRPACPGSESPVRTGPAGRRDGGYRR